MTQDTEGTPARPASRRRVRRALSSVPLRLLRRIIEEQNHSALHGIPDAALNEEEAEIYRFVRQHYARAGRFPAMITMEENRMQLPEAPEPLAFYREAMRTSLRMRNAAELIVRLQEAINANDGDAIAEALAVRAQDLADVGTSIIRADTLAERVRDSLNPSTSLRAISLTGIPGIDLTVGGVARGDLGFLYARPAVGKTFLQLSGAVRKAMGGERVLFLSKEMTAEQAMHRVVMMHYDVDPSLGLTKRVSTYAYREMMERMTGGLPAELVENLLITDDPAVRTPEDFAALIRETQPELAMLDGSYFLKPAARGTFNSQTERFSQIVRELREAARDTRTGIWATWQQNRTKAVGADGMYGTDAATQDAGLAVELRRSKRDKTIREAIPTKTRHGPEGERIGLTYRFKPTSVGELVQLAPEEDDGDAGGRAERARTVYVERSARASRTPPPAATPRPSARAATPNTYEVPQ